MKKNALIILVTVSFFACKNEQSLAVKSHMIDQAKYDLVGYYFEMKDGGFGLVTEFDRIEPLAIHAGGVTKIEQIGVLRSASEMDLGAAFNYVNK